MEPNIIILIMAILANLGALIIAVLAAWGVGN